MYIIRTPIVMLLDVCKETQHTWQSVAG